MMINNDKEKCRRKYEAKMGDEWRMWQRGQLKKWNKNRNNVRM